MMYRLIIDGKEVELENKTELSFIYENSLFVFGDITLNRTMSFKIPRTPENDNIFGFSHLPELAGMFVRKTCNAALWYSGGAIDGEIMITDYSDKNYNAVFIYGEIEILNKIKTIEKISDIVTVNDTVFWGSTNIAVNSDLVGNYGIGKYLNLLELDIPLKTNYLPSVKLSYLFNKCMEYLGVNLIIFNKLNYENLYLKKNDLIGKFVFKEEIYQVDMAYYWMIDPEGDINDPNNWVYSPHIEISGGKSISVVSRKFKTLSNTEILIYGFRANIDMILEFKTYAYPFLSFNQKMETKGSSASTQFSLWESGNVLAMQKSISVSMELGEEIYIQFVDNHNYFVQNSAFAKDGWANFEIIPFGSLHGELLKAKLNKQNILEYNTTINLSENIPEISLYNFIKLLAFINNSGVIYRDNMIEFYDYEFAERPISLDEKFNNQKNIKRCFLDFAQNNFFKFNSNEYVRSRVINNMEVFNESLSLKKDIFQIEFSETDIDFNDIALSIDIQSDGSNFELLNTTTEIMKVSNGKPFTQVNFFSNTHLNKILEKSTEVTATFFMTLYEFQQIKEKTTFLLHNKKYAWRNAKWQKNIAELTLILID